MNCAGNCGGVDGVIRITLSRNFPVDKKGNLRGSPNHLFTGQQFGSGKDSVQECHANFSFKNGTNLISGIKQELAGGLVCHEPSGSSLS